MLVRITKDVYEKDKDGNEQLKVTRHHGVSIPWVVGRTILLSDESAKKWIERGAAEAVSDTNDTAAASKLELET